MESIVVDPFLSSVLSARDPLLWELGSQNPVLEKEEVHLWRSAIEPKTENIESHLNLLDERELFRANSFVLKRHRERFIVQRAFLRILLSRYLKRHPAEITLFYNDHGKPSVDTVQNPELIEFNLSHSEDRMLVAFTKNRRLGIDLEKKRGRASGERFLCRFCTVDEGAKIAQLPQHLKEDLILNLWTSKEAYLKAAGFGLSVSPIHFKIDFLNELDRAVVFEKGDPLFEPCFLRQILPEPGYIAALAVEGPPPILRPFQLKMLVL